jgi:hypothetical protein
MSRIGRRVDVCMLGEVGERADLKKVDYEKMGSGNSV